MLKKIIEETATIPTNNENLYERFSAAGFIGLRGTLEFQSRAASRIEAGKFEEVYVIIDELYEKVRNGAFQSENVFNNETNKDYSLTWDDIRSYAKQGHEFASHMVIHPYLAGLDEANMLYELEKSREDNHYPYTFA